MSVFPSELMEHMPACAEMIGNAPAPYLARRVLRDNCSITLFWYCTLCNCTATEDHLDSGRHRDARVSKVLAYYAHRAQEEATRQRLSGFAATMMEAHRNARRRIKSCPPSPWSQELVLKPVSATDKQSHGPMYVRPVLRNSGALSKVSPAQSQGIPS